MGLKIKKIHSFVIYWICLKYRPDSLLKLKIAQIHPVHGLQLIIRVRIHFES